jgi:hypothetical protein
MSFSLQRLSETFLVLRRIERDIIINVYRACVKYPLFLSDFDYTRTFSTDLRKYSNLIYQVAWKFVRWKPSCAHGRTDVTMLIVAFRNFANAPKTNQLMSYREIFAAGFENHSKHVNALCWQHAETFMLKASLLSPQHSDWYLGPTNLKTEWFLSKLVKFGGSWSRSPSAEVSEWSQTSTRAYTLMICTMITLPCRFSC